METTSPAIQPVPEYCIESWQEQCELALKGLQLAIEAHLKRVTKLEGKLAALDIQRQRQRQALCVLKRFRTRAQLRTIMRSMVNKSKQRSSNLKTEIMTLLTYVEEYRALLAIQIEHTTDFGYGDLVEPYVKFLLDEQTSFETETETAETIVCDTITDKKHHIAAVWQAVRAAVKQAMDSGKQLLPAFTEAISLRNIQPLHVAVGT